jgi:hypothetical protein
MPIRSRLSINTAEAAIDAACGLGVTRVLSYQAAQAIADSKLRSFSVRLSLRRCR